jgi:hypothetical protein
MEQRQIESVNQLGQLAAGVYSPSNFGAEGLPTIRGTLAEIYQNGQRIKTMRNSFPPSFNGAEVTEIIKGGASVVYGSGSSATGGYVNLVTKTPHFDKWTGEVSMKIGDYVPGGQSYSRLQWGFDTTGPLIKDKLAMRVSYLGREADSYYNNLKDDVQDGFAALAWLPYEGLKVDLTGQFYESRFNENAGWNRVTQDLVNNGTYIRGGINSTFAPWAGTVDPGVDGSYADQKQKLYHNQVLVHPGDSAYGKRGLGQLIVTFQVDPDFTIKSSTYGEYTESRKYSAYGYTELNPDNITFDHRTEFQLNFDTPYIDPTPAKKVKKDGKDMKSYVEVAGDPGFVVGNKVNLGFDFRYEHAEAYSAFANEPFAVYDISGKNPTPLFPQQGGGAGVFDGDRPVPGHPNYFASQDNFGPGSFSQAILSDFYRAGLFYQHEFDVTEQWTVITGTRADFVGAEAGNPALLPGNFGNNYYLPKAERDATWVVNGDFYGSVNYKPVKEVTLYTAYNRTNGYNEANNSGAISYITTSGGTAANPVANTDVPNANLRQLSVLMEGGAKISLFDDKLFLGVAGYRQNRITRAQNGSLSKVDARGVEVEATYQPNRNFNIISNLTWQEANLVDGGVYRQTGSIGDVFAPGVPYQSNGAVGTGAGSPNYAFTARQYSRVEGYPNILFNAYAVYKFDFGLSVGAGPSVTGPIQGGTTIPTQFTIPWQHTWNAFVQYAQPRWEARVNIFNFTDERNITPGSPGFASNDLIYPEMPLRINASFKFKF